jgi:hypothetical protein
VPPSAPARPPLQLTEQHEAVLRIFAEASDWKSAPPERVAEIVGINSTRTRYLLDELRDDNYISISVGELSALYSLSKKGRAYAVQQGYC